MQTIPGDVRAVDLYDGQGELCGHNGEVDFSSFYFQPHERRMLPTGADHLTGGRKTGG